MQEFHRLGSQDLAFIGIAIFDAVCGCTHMTRLSLKISIDVGAAYYDPDEAPLARCQLR